MRSGKELSTGHIKVLQQAFNMPLICRLPTLVTCAATAGKVGNGLDFESTQSCHHTH